MYYVTVFKLAMKIIVKEILFVEGSNIANMGLFCNYMSLDTSN